MNHLSRHISFDDPRYYRFERNSGLPVGTFPRSERRRWPKVDYVVMWVCVIALCVAGLIP